MLIDFSCMGKLKICSIVLVVLVFIGCGSSANQRFGESFALIDIAKFDTEENNNKCTFQGINEISFALGDSAVICLVVENRLTKQSIILRDFELELRIPRVGVQVPITRVTLPGFLKPAPSESDSDTSGNGQNTTALRFKTNRLLKILAQETPTNKASIPVIYPPLELTTWLISNISLLPAGIIPVEAIFRVHGQTSPSGDWISTNRFYLRSYISR